MVYHNWLVVWNMNFIFHFIYRIILPKLTNSYFSRCLLHHQPDHDDGCMMLYVPHVWLDGHIQMLSRFWWLTPCFYTISRPRTLATTIGSCWWHLGFCGSQFPPWLKHPFHFPDQAYWALIMIIMAYILLVWLVKYQDGARECLTCHRYIMKDHRWIPIMNLTVANEKTPSRARRTTPNRTTRRVPGTISTRCRTREQLVARTGSGLLRFGEDVGELWGNGWNMMEYDGMWWNNYDGIWWNMMVLARFFFFYGDGSLWFNQLGVDSCRNLYECWYLVGITTTSHQIGNGKPWRKHGDFTIKHRCCFPLNAGIFCLWDIRIWYDVIWYNMIWHDMTWHDIIWYNMMYYDMIWYDIIWYNMMYYDMIWYNMIWYDIIWYDMIWNNMI